MGTGELLMVGVMGEGWGGRGEYQKARRLGLVGAVGGGCGAGGRA